MSRENIAESLSSTQNQATSGTSVSTSNTSTASTAGAPVVTYTRARPPSTRSNSSFTKDPITFGSTALAMYSGASTSGPGSLNGSSDRLSDVTTTTTNSSSSVLHTQLDRTLNLNANTNQPSSSRSSSILHLGLGANGSGSQASDSSGSSAVGSGVIGGSGGAGMVPGANGERSGMSTPEVDAQILEALKSKDRLFVLKLGEQMEALVRERSSRTSFKISPENQYQRLLVHRCAQYYRMSPENDPAMRDKPGARDMVVIITTDSKIPRSRISDLVPAEQTAHPTFKIMRRNELDRHRQKSATSRAGSIAGEDGELSDPGPSESGSMGSRSTTSKKRMTIAEREAAYEAARSRIFMDFEEKEKTKGRDASASSSTLSLASASGSGSQSGGAGCSSDIEDNASTAPTESEWSVPGTDRRRAGDRTSSTDIPRSYPLNATNGYQGRTQDPSSSFTFPSLYDPVNNALTYDPAAQPIHPGAYMAPPYPMYPYPPGAASMGSPQPYMPYPYFPQYPYPPPPQPHFSNSDPTSPATGTPDGYHHPPYANPNPYGWMPPPSMHRQSSSESQPSSIPEHGHPSQTPPHMAYGMPYPPYMPPPPGAVPYGYPPPPPTCFSSPQIQHPPMMRPPYAMEVPQQNGDRADSSGVPSSNGSPSPTLSRDTNSSSSSSNGHVYNQHGHHMSDGGFRGSAPAGRGVWGYNAGMGPSAGVGMQPKGRGTSGEAMGPRLTSGLRRTSGNSSTSSGYKTPAEEVTSGASSSSSSTRKPVLSTPPKHPLPARPDWAAGIKAQPTLHTTSRHRHDSNTSRTMSPALPPQSQLYPIQGAQYQPNVGHGAGAGVGNTSGIPQRPQVVTLKSNDFPPLSGASGQATAMGTGTNSVTDRRPNVPSGVWTNPRPILSNNTAQKGAPAGFAGAGGSRLEDDEKGFDRPPPKNSAELFNPKGGAKRTSGQSHGQGFALQNQPHSASVGPLPPHQNGQRQEPLIGTPSVEEQAAESERVKKEAAAAVADAILADREVASGSSRTEGDKNNGVWKGKD